MNLVSNWFKRQMSNPQIVFLAIAVLFVFFFVYFFGGILSPFLASIVVAYILEGSVKRLQKYKLPRSLSIAVVMIVFVTIIAFIMIWLVPILTKQISQLLRQLPLIINAAQNVLLELPLKYPDLVSVEQVSDLVRTITNEIGQYGERFLTFSLASFRNIVTLMLFLFIVPIMVFFLLKDKNKIIGWGSNFLPNEHELAKNVWTESNLQISNYIRGKILEIMIVGSVSIITFIILGLDYAILLGVMVGFSVIIPYVGAVIITIPVYLIAWFQWGPSQEFVYLAVAYLVIQVLDGNLLVPVLFSEVVNLHPIAIIVSVLFFGGLWGVWGIFFAIPLATIVQAIIRSWPKDSQTTPG